MATPIRVAFLFTTLHRGGTESQALLLMDGVDRKRFSLHAYTLGDGPLHQELSKRKIPVRVFPTTTANAMSAMRDIRAAMREDKIDILHCLLWHGNIIGRLACRTTHVRCINSVRWAERIVRRDIVDMPTRMLVHHWIANSTHGAKIAQLPRKKTSIIHNGLPQSLLKEHAWKPVSKTAIMIGQFRREKQYDVLLQTAHKLPDWRFTLVGDGPMLEQTKQLAAKLKLQNVTFAGHVNEASALMLTHAAAILLSKSEGNPNVALEAMARGVPFIGSDIPAHRSLLENGRGIIVQPAPDSVVAALQALHQMTPAKRDAMRKAAKKYVRETYNAKRMVEETEHVWLALLKAQMLL